MEKKQKKEQLIKDNAILAEKLKSFEDRDLARRTVLSELLDSYEYISDSYAYSNNKQKKQTIVRDWLGIAFLIGELKSDADYSCVIEGREIFRRENEELKEQIYRLTHPEEKKGETKRVWYQMGYNEAVITCEEVLKVYQRTNTYEGDEEAVFRTTIKEILSALSTLKN